MLYLKKDITTNILLKRRKNYAFLSTKTINSGQRVQCDKKEIRKLNFKFKLTTPIKTKHFPDNTSNSFTMT